MFKSTAITNNIINGGKGKPCFPDLKYQADTSTKGTIHNVLASLRVTATSTESKPTTDAAPTTDAVSWIARAAQVPNCSCVKSSQPHIKGKINTATAFSRNTMLKVVVKSSGLALIEGAAAAIAVPPQIAVPEASR